MLQPETRIRPPTETVRYARVRIAVIKGVDAGIVVDSAGKTVRVGTAESADLRLHDDTVSREHCEIELNERGFRIRDSKSTNGVRVHGLRVYDVSSGSPLEMTIGDTVLALTPLGDAETRERTSVGCFGDLLGESTKMRELFAMLARIAPTDLSVLIEGETGTGKELVAQSIHKNSARADGPFVVFDCSAVASNLIESDLFGHERGAFTGAHAAKLGLIELARGGTLFFDEVGELPLRLQVKLLRAVEERAVRRVGGVDPRPVDVRYVSATNRDLEQEVEAGRFRRDLYFRLAGATLYIPSLRERLDEILPLAERFVADAAAGLGRPAVRLSQDAHAWLVQHEWPGNVRELRSACERAVLLCEDGVLRGGHFQGPTRVRPASRSAPPPVPADDTGADNDNDSEGEGDDRASATAPGFADRASMPEAARREVEVIERRRILAALEQAGGNQTRAAALLGISRRTLVNRLGAYDLPRPRKPRL